jgi:hypothetical protein
VDLGNIPIKREHRRRVRFVQRVVTITSNPMTLRMNWHAVTIQSKIAWCAIKILTWTTRDGTKLRAKHVNMVKSLEIQVPIRMHTQVKRIAQNHRRLLVQNSNTLTRLQLVWNALKDLTAMVFQKIYVDMENTAPVAMEQKPKQSHAKQESMVMCEDKKAKQMHVQIAP